MQCTTLVYCTCIVVCTWFIQQLYSTMLSHPIDMYIQIVYALGQYNYITTFLLHFCVEEQQYKKLNINLFYIFYLSWITIHDSTEGLQTCCYNVVHPSVSYWHLLTIHVHHKLGSYPPTILM